MSRVWSSLQDLVTAKAEIKEAKRLADSGGRNDKIKPGETYFTAHINEMFLKNEREWFSKYDPIVIVVSEHKYNGTNVVVPTIVGPELINKYVKEIPEGMAFFDTRVAGIHPYEGGQFALTMILAKVERVNYATRMLEFIEKTAGAFEVGGTSVDLSGQIKIAEALMSGVRGLFGLKETMPIMGQRMVYDHGHTQWFKTGSYAMVDKDIDRINWGEMQVKDGRLFKGDGRYRDEDFVLFSLNASDARSDWQLLPFYRSFDAIIRVALDPEEDKGWEKAKAMYLALYSELMTSPDVTWNQALVIAEELKGKLLQVKTQREGMQFLGSDKAHDGALPLSAPEMFSFQTERAEVLRASANLLDL